MLIPGALYEAQGTTWTFKNFQDAKRYYRAALSQSNPFWGRQMVAGSVFFLLGLEHRMLKILQGEEVSYVIYPFEHSPSFVFQRLDLPESSEFIKKAAKDIIAGKVNPPRLRKKDE